MLLHLEGVVQHHFEVVALQGHLESRLMRQHTLIPKPLLERVPEVITTAKFGDINHLLPIQCAEQVDADTGSCFGQIPNAGRLQ